MKSFITVGKALLTIRDQGLYREGYKTFLAYCADRWGMGKNYANRQITGSRVAANLIQECNVTPRGVIMPPCEIQPTSEYQCRPLVVLEPNQQREVWEEAVKTAPAGKVCHFRTPAISVSGGFSDKTAETASVPSGLCRGRRRGWGRGGVGDGAGGPLAAWQGYPCRNALGCPLCGPWRGCGAPESS